MMDNFSFMKIYLILAFFCVTVFCFDKDTCSCDKKLVRKQLTKEKYQLEIVWPGYFDLDYCSERITQCVWDVSTNIRNKDRIRVEFHNFNLSTGNFLTIYGTHPSPVETCFQSKCLPYESVTGHVTLALETGHNFNISTGFRAIFTALQPDCNCGKTDFKLNLNETIQLTSPNFPFYYCNKMKCGWNFDSPKDTVILINFTQFHIRNSYDFVEVFDGKAVTDSRIRICTGPFCGSLSSSSNHLLVQFQSYQNFIQGPFRIKRNSWIHGLSFEAFVTVIPSSHDQLCYYQKSRTIQLDELYETKEIHSFNYPFGYCPNTNFFWKITSPNGTQISLTFNDFTIESGDSVKISDGFQKSDLLLQRCDGFVCPAIHSSGNELQFQLQSDSHDQQQGFRAHVSVTPINCDCRNGVRTVESMNTSVSIASPNFPYYNYCTNLHCQWTVKVPRRHVVLINFGSEFHTEPRSDQVSMFDGNEKRLLQRCSGHSQCKPAISSLDWLDIEFDSDDRITDSGFIFHATAKLCDCNSEVIKVDAANGSVIINGPEFYCQQSTCWWSIEAAENQKLKLEFEQINVEQDDVIAVHEGLGTVGKLLRRYYSALRMNFVPVYCIAHTRPCYGNSSKCESVSTDGQFLYLTFHSGSSGVTNLGFQAITTAIQKPPIIDLSIETLLLGSIGITITFAAIIFLLILTKLAICNNNEHAQFV